MYYRVYVAGPLTDGDTAMNVRRALEAANQLLLFGFWPYVPHLTHFWHFAFPDERPHETSKWMALDKAWLAACDAMLVLPGESKGVEVEKVWARELDIPIFYSIRSLAESQT